MAISYGLLMTISYSSIYTIFIFITSIICAIKVRQMRRSAASSSKNNKWYSPIKQWPLMIMEKRRIYAALIPHVFDQATDYGVVFTYYSLWTEAERTGIKEIGDADPKYFFIASCFVIILHRVISTIAVYRLTKNWKDAALQSIDGLMAKAIWINYKLNKTSPSNPQRYLQILEATFESAPQILISSGFLLKSSTKRLTDDKEATSPLIYVSVIFSLWSLVSRVAADDKMLFGGTDKESTRWRDLEFKYNKCPCINWRYLYRVFVWRFLEITNRIFTFILLWVNIGGLGLSVIIGAEFIYCCMVCFFYKSIDFIASLMYLTPVNPRESSENWLNAFWIYRIISSVLYLILITIFCLLSFEAAKVEEARTRKRVTVSNPFGLFILIYSWISALIWPLAAKYALTDQYANYYERDLKTLIKEGNCEEALELIEFGTPIHSEILKDLSEFATKLNDINNKICIFRIMIIAISRDKTASLQQLKDGDKLFDHQEEVKEDGGLIHLAVIKTPNYENDSPKILENVLNDVNINVNAIDNDGNTALHIIVKNADSFIGWNDSENIKKLLKHNIDINIENNDGKTVYDIINDRDDLNEEQRNYTNRALLLRS